MKYKALIARSLAGLMFTLSAHAAQNSPIAKVRGIYVEAARHVLIQESLIHSRPGARRWSEVDLGPGVPAEKRRRIVALPRKVQAETGDLVVLESGASRVSGAKSIEAPIVLPSRVVMVKAKWFSYEAASFGRTPLRVRMASAGAE